jgi:hypothetical protein
LRPWQRFPANTNYRTGALPIAAAIKDFNHDGFPDIATANQNDFNVSVLLANPDGTFNLARDYPVADLSGPAVFKEMLKHLKWRRRSR